MAIDRAAVIAAPSHATGAKVRKLEVSYLSPASKQLSVSVTQLAQLAPRDKYSQEDDTYVVEDGNETLRIVLRPVVMKNKKHTGKVCIQAIAQF